MSVDRPLSVRRLDWMIVALSTVLVLGLFLIAAAAQQALLPDRSVSVWHIPAYLAYVALGAVLVGVALTTKAPASIPHRGALMGVGIVALGIVTMFLWSSLFGAENGIGAYVNPPILVIVSGVVLIVSAPWLDTTPAPAGLATWRLQAPAVVSIALTLLVLV